MLSMRAKTKYTVCVVAVASWKVKMPPNLSSKAHAALLRNRAPFCLAWGFLTRKQNLWIGLFTRHVRASLECKSLGEVAAAARNASCSSFFLLWGNAWQQRLRMLGRQLPGSLTSGSSSAAAGPIGGRRVPRHLSARSVRRDGPSF